MLFSIQNMYCGYGEKDVLFIDKFHLEKGTITFLLGKSGIGKSTFLETIGLMNNTINATSHSKLLFYEDQDPIDIKNIWDSGDNVLSKFRTDHFGFIFQNTNLLANLSVGDNIAVTSMLSDGKNPNRRNEIEESLEAIGLDRKSYDKKVYQLSGGQKQRVAFLRAIYSKYDILFCDEPTGNLDDITAHKLFEILKSNIINKGKSCLVVSHDISLALEFADRIQLLISQRLLADEDKIGYLSDKHSIEKKESGWNEFNSDRIVQNPKSWVDDKLKIEN